MADGGVSKSVEAAQDINVAGEKSEDPREVQLKMERDLSEAINKARSKYVEPVAPPNRVECSQFVQALWSLLKDLYHMRHSTAFGEARMFDAMEGLRYLVRSFESGPVDGALISLPVDMADVPEQGCSYTELWCWARTQEDVQFIPFDVKYVQLRAEPPVTQEYSWSVGGRRRKRDFQNAEFYFIVFEACPRNFAVVPSGTWKMAKSRGYGVEPLIDDIPSWYQPFMVHSRHIVRALRSLLRASRGLQPYYVNPTTRVKLKGWHLRATANPRVDPMEKEQVAACISFLRLREMIQEAGGVLHGNHVAPLMYDATASLPGTDLLDYELKFTSMKCKDLILKLGGRWSPFAKRRLWHVLWCECKDGIICITRDESPIAWARSKRAEYRAKLPPDVIKKHYFRSYSAAFTHIREHASRAQEAVKCVISDITPGQIDRYLSKKISRRALETMVLRGAQDDPLTGLNAAQTSLPWIVGVLNEWCRKAGFGIVLPLDPRHPWGDHIFVRYKWSDADKKRRKLPRSVFDARLRHERCIVLRFLDLSPTSNLPAGSLLTMRRAYWKKPLENGHFILVGSVLSREIQEQDTQRSSSYLLLPSEFTSMWATRCFVSKAPKAERANGRHVFQRTTAESQRLPHYGRPGPTPFDSHFLSDPSMNLDRYILNLVDGTIFHELQKILEGGGTTCIQHPLAKKPNKTFDASKYHTTVRKVLQTAVDYGYQIRIQTYQRRAKPRPYGLVHSHTDWRRRPGGLALKNPRLGRGARGRGDL